MERARAISARRLTAKVGKQTKVLVDAVEGGVAIARTEGDAPEIDGVVRIEDGESLKPGDWAEVRITSADAYDLSARLMSRGRDLGRGPAKASVENRPVSNKI
jgi:ribosomal protein S12 methylthiotransferase